MEKVGLCIVAGMGIIVLSTFSYVLILITLNIIRGLFAMISDYFT